MENKDLNVEVVFVDKARNTVDLQGDVEGQFQVVAPADIKWARNGTAVAKINQTGQIVYLRSTAPKTNTYNKPYTKPTGQSGFKPYTQRNNFNTGNNYTPKKEVDWDKLAWGKCKYGFLIEAFKLGMTLDKAEIEAEKWANASVRKLTEKDIINKEISKVVPQQIPQEPIQEQKEYSGDDNYDDNIPEESMGYF